MKKIFTVIFGIIFVLFIGINFGVATVTNKTKYPEPVLVKRKGLKVYIPPKNKLTQTMKYAFMDWQKHSGDEFTFEFVGTKSTANIEVIFMESGIGNICKGIDALGCTTYNTKTLYGNMRIYGVKVYISAKDNKGQPMTENEVYTIMLHEIGHALGLKHSNDIHSLMYAGTNANMAELQEIQPEDVENLFKLYKIEQTDL